MVRRFDSLLYCGMLAVPGELVPGSDHYFQEYRVFWLHDKNGSKVKLRHGISSSFEHDIRQNLHHRYLDLQKGESETDALPGTHAERHVRVCNLFLPLLGGKSLGVECFRIEPNLWVSMENVGRHKHINACRKVHAVDGARFLTSAVN